MGVGAVDGVMHLIKQRLNVNTLGQWALMLEIDDLPPAAWSVTWEDTQSQGLTKTRGFSHAMSYSFSVAQMTGYSGFGFTESTTVTNQIGSTWTHSGSTAKSTGSSKSTTKEVSYTFTEKDIYTSMYVHCTVTCYLFGGYDRCM